MSNCVVGLGGLRLPCSTIAEHSVESCDHFSHDGEDDDLGFFVGVGEALVEGLTRSRAHVWFKTAAFPGQRLPLGFSPSAWLTHPYIINEKVLR